MSGVNRRIMLEGSLGLAFAGSVLNGLGAFASHLDATQQSGPGSREGVRRIVTANNAQGRSFILSDEIVTGGTFPNLFKTTADNLGPGAPNELKAILAGDSPNLEPVKGGCSLTYVQLPPGRPGSKPVWHRTQTLDFNILLSGELELLVDEGTVTLRPFSLVVQRNTNHAWVNRSATEPVRWVAILLPAGSV